MQRVLSSRMYRITNIFLHQATESSSVIGLVGDVDGAMPLRGNRYVCQDSVQ